jgi:DNA ligase-1
MKKILYKKNINGSTNRWTIFEAGNSLNIFWGQLNGAEQYQIVDIEVNQSGRSMEEQMKLEMDSRISKQLDKGYRYTIQEAEDFAGLNSLNMYKPMLAVKYRDVAHRLNVDNCLHQYKFNGHRCLITNLNGEHIAYSRNGKIIDTIPHILAQLNVPSGVTLDGELYLHGCRLQTISSYVKRAQPMTKNLIYVVYDVINDMNYMHRQAQALRYVKEGATNVIHAPTFACTGLDLMQRLKIVKQMGYEGLMLRQKHTGYEPGARSAGLIKLKSCEDDEYEVVDIESSADGWAILVCRAGDGRLFKVSAPGTIENKTHIWNNPELFIGRYINVEYFEKTERGVPFHAVATGWRDKGEE